MMHELSEAEQEISMEEIRERKANLERMKRTTALLEDEYKRRFVERENRQKAREERLSAIAKAKEEAKKLTLAVSVAQERKTKIEQLTRKLDDTKRKLSQIKKQKKETNLARESTLTEKELELLQSIEECLHRFSDKEKRVRELGEKLSALEKSTVETEEHLAEVRYEKEIMERELKDLEQKIQGERDQVNDLRSKLAGKDTASSIASTNQSLYAEAENERQKLAQEVQELYRTYRAMKTQIEEIDALIKREDDKKNESAANFRERRAILESAYRKRIKDLERMVATLKNKYEWPPLQFEANDLNTDEFARYHKILESKRKATEELKVDYGQLAQTQMNLSLKAERLRLKKNELLREKRTLEEDKTRQVTETKPKDPEVKRVNFALCDE